MTIARHTSDESVEWSGRLTAADVHGVMFTRSGLGRRGYEETEVDEFLDRVQAEIQRLTAEKSDLRDEAGRLKRHLERAGSAEPQGLNREEAAVQAVSVLSAAQQTADQYVADAESYSKRLSSDAREQSESLILEARMRAAQIIRDAEHAAQDAADAVMQSTASSDGAAGRTKEELEEQVAYLRTFSQVCRTQLRSYLEALLQDIEVEWGKADPAAVLSSPALPRQMATPPHTGSDGREDSSSEAPPADRAVDPEPEAVSAEAREVVLNGHARAAAE